MRHTTEKVFMGHSWLYLPDTKLFTGALPQYLPAVFWALGDVLLPFVMGAAIAYLLDPVADRLRLWV